MCSGLSLIDTFVHIRRGMKQVSSYVTAEDAARAYNAGKLRERYVEGSFLKYMFVRMCRVMIRFGSYATAAEDALACDAGMRHV